MRNKYLVLVGVLVLALLIAACSNQQPSTEGTAIEPKADEKVADETAAPATTQSEGSSLANLLKAKQNLKFMVEWDVNSQAQGQTVNTKMTQYFKDAKNFRTDVITQGMEVRSYLLNDVLNSCFNVAGKWTCQQIAYQPSASDQSENDIIAGKADYKVTKLPSKTVAGTLAECYQTVAEQATVTYCFSSEGAPLYIKSEAAGAISEMTATKYSTTVADSVFELPQ